jgi:hypothetical protein
MRTGDLFLCKVCALPIRNTKQAVPTGQHQFVCENCDVCYPDRQAQMSALQQSLRSQLRRIAHRLYRYITGSSLTPESESKIDERLNKQTNPADDALDAISKILNNSNSSEDDVLRQVAESERILAGFFTFLAKE